MLYDLSAKIHVSM